MAKDVPLTQQARPDWEGYEDSSFHRPAETSRSTPGTPTSLERAVRCAGYVPYLTLFLDPSPSGHDLGRESTINGR